MYSFSPSLRSLFYFLITIRGEKELAISISRHAQNQMRLRGYYKEDIESAIFNGNIVERQGWGKFVIEGKDTDNNPIVLVVAKTREKHFLIVTVMPPLDKTRFKECIS